jgi:hypothetical protein
MNNDVNATAVDPTSGHGLEDLEAIIARGLPSYDAVSMALFEIHERRLYLKLYGSFREYIRRRWQFSRARAYQILHFARLKQLSTTVDTKGAPKNERQARALDGQGNPRSDEQADPVLRAMSYLSKVFERLPISERADFIDSIGDLLHEFRQEVARQRPTSIAPAPTSGPKHDSAQPMALSVLGRPSGVLSKKEE